MFNKFIPDDFKRWFWPQTNNWLVQLVSSAGNSQINWNLKDRQESRTLNTFKALYYLH